MKQKLTMVLLVMVSVLQAVEMTPDPAEASYKFLYERDIVEPYSAPKAMTLSGVVYRSSDLIGIVELKLGKVNLKKDTSKVSGSVMTLDGKKHAIKAFSVTGISDTTPKAVSLDVKDFGTMAITIGGTQFAGSMGTYHVQSATVGGNLDRDFLLVEVQINDLTMFNGHILQELLPNSVIGAVGMDFALVEAWIEDLREYDWDLFQTFFPNADGVKRSGNGKWSFERATSVKFSKVKDPTSMRYPEYFYPESGKGLIVGEGNNPSGLKLTYTPKRGSFKGSFKVYALEGERGQTKLKNYTVKVSGVVVGGVGHGMATYKKPALAWSVMVK